MPPKGYKLPIKEEALRKINVCRKAFDLYGENANFTQTDILDMIEKALKIPRRQVRIICRENGLYEPKVSKVYVKSENPNTYICPMCGLEKDKTEFARKGNSRSGEPRVYPYCKTCANAYQKPLTIKRLYNLTMEEYNALGDTCNICGRVEKKMSNAVDHDHTTGLIRGRICQRCNRGLAWFQEDFVLFQRCADYLLSPPAPSILGREVYGRTGRMSNKRGNKKRYTREDIRIILDV